MNQIVMNSIKPNIKSGPLTKAALILLTVLATTGTAFGQDEATSSRRETEAIKQVEANGGRVFRISAADTSREVSFYLSSKPVGDEQLKGVDAIGEVIWVNLAGTNITNKGLQHLAGLPIKKLHLERTKIGDDGLKHLKSFKELAYLNVYDTKVTDAGLEHLKDLKQLKKLYVWKSGVTEAGMKKLNESLPDLKIVGELKLEPVVIEEPKKEEPPKPKDTKAEGKPADSEKAAEKKKADEKTDGKKPGDEQAKKKKRKNDRNNKKKKTSDKVD